MKVNFIYGIFLIFLIYPLTIWAESLCQNEKNEPKEICNILKNVIDPELQVSIVDLGLVENIELIGNRKVNIKLVVTSFFCPYTYFIRDLVIKELKKNGWQAEVIIDKNKLWNVERINPLLFKEKDVKPNN